ncbi:MAG: amino acid ABC transporter permease [Candidatus Nanopelagicales bacterium]
MKRSRHAVPTPILYDAPGPGARRRALIGGAVAFVAIVILIALALRRLDETGQLDWEKWAPLLDPNNDQFDELWRFLWGGLKNTLKAAALAIFCSLIVGTLLAVWRISSGRTTRWAVVSVIELFRGVPVVIAIFFAARVLPEVGVDLDLIWYLVIGLTVYNSVVIAEIVRAGVASLPKGQTESAYAIGLTRGQTLRLVLLPQAFRVMLPALISQLVVVLKDTSLGFIISFEELLRRANIAVQTLHNPIQMYLVVGAIYVIINYMLSRLAVYAERRLSRGHRGGPAVAAPPPELATELAANASTIPGAGPSGV